MWPAHARRDNALAEVAIGVDPGGDPRYIGGVIPWIEPRRSSRAASPITRRPLHELIGARACFTRSQRQRRSGLRKPKVACRPNLKTFQFNLTPLLRLWTPFPPSPWLRRPG